MKQLIRGSSITQLFSLALELVNNPTRQDVTKQKENFDSTKSTVEFNVLMLQFSIFCNKIKFLIKVMKSVEVNLNPKEIIHNS